MEHQKILIVDDISKNIQLAANVLKNTDYMISFAQDGQSALKKLKAVKFDLVLLDIMMPEMDGYDVCKEMKKDEDLKDIPVIFLTAKTDSDSIIKGFENGAVDYIVKPFNNKELLARVKTHLELKKSRENLEIQKKSLEELNAMKNRFLSVIGHDLKGPIGTLEQALKVVRDKLLDKEEEEMLIEELVKSSGNVYRLLENLLAWGKSQQENFVYNPVPIKLQKVVLEIIELLKPIANDKKVSLVSKISDTIHIDTDRNIVQTVIRNLVSNAIKYSNCESVVEITYELLEDKHVISVKDQGIGMNEEIMSKLFKITEKVSRRGTKAEMGTGLGLIIASDFLKKIGGNIEVSSVEGEGSTFRVIL
ncbi:MAG: hybrid sensor histidine kinase/response regulator [Candidatus Delongbacteria bacterium]|nr:hybrid sensor histidine kinase/response regulator [Candidatus Delongbacteria bacterium]MBN2834327.1 hybrid sensor histidine kinase/response regulator [Candidatus Delongbacteria bacterium]